MSDEQPFDQAEAFLDKQAQAMRESRRIATETREARVIALNAALQGSFAGMSADHVVKRAAAFEAYLLSGYNPPDEVPQQTQVFREVCFPTRRR